ncbi:MAG: hypothetical protein WCG86_07395 [Actinomycetota bacterium]|jgi:hypothetical protein
MKMPRWTPQAWANFFAVAAVVYVVLWSVHPNLLFSGSTVTGGDTGAHVATARFLRDHLSTGLTSWYPGWFAGTPLYTYYFVLPDLLAAVASYVTGFAVAFKVATILGSVLMPLCAFVMARLFRARDPIPAMCALATLPFLFDSSFTIDGGNLFSTLAGEYAFSLSLALSLLVIGLVARGLRTGRGVWLSGVALALTLSSHVLPMMFALVMLLLLWFMEVLNATGSTDATAPARRRGDIRRASSFLLRASALGAGLSAWWWLPFVASQTMTNPMGYTNVPVGTMHEVFTALGWFNASGGAGGDRWVILLTGVALLASIFWRDRLGILLTMGAVCSLVIFVIDPQGEIFNERLVPFWYLTTHLAVGWLVGAIVLRIPRRLVPDDKAPVEPLLEYREGRRIVRSIYLGIIFFVGVVVAPQLGPIATALHLHPGANEVTGWSQWNYSGYEAKTAWPEYHQIMIEMSRVGQSHGCGRAMWEYSSDQSRFGTPMGLMLLPYWTNNCIDSMEGLLFESSATTPYHFLDQAELSASPSNPQTGLPYGNFDDALGIQHLQMLGVKYYLAFSSEAVSAAKANKSLRDITPPRPTTSPASAWRIYEILSSPLVEGVRLSPLVNPHLASRSAWLAANTQWWLRNSNQDQMLASSGPAEWPRVGQIARSYPRVTVSNVTTSESKISFSVDKIGVPILVKVSYFPRWNASGASGPWRVSPNLMVVVPQTRHVSLTYGTTTAMYLGQGLTLLTILLGLRNAYLRRRWRRPRDFYSVSSERI